VRSNRKLSQRGTRATFVLQALPRMRINPIFIIGIYRVYAQMCIEGKATRWPSQSARALSALSAWAQRLAFSADYCLPKSCDVGPRGG